MGRNSLATQPWQEILPRTNDCKKKLGKHKTGKSCLYIKRLEDVDTEVLQQLIEASVAYVRKKYDT